MSLSPTVSYFKRVLLKLLGPPAFILTIRQGLLAHGSSHYLPSFTQSTGGTVLLSVASSILYISAKIWWHSLSTAAEARRLGATVVPKVKGKLPGNIDVLWDMARYWADDYVGQGATELSKQYGNTFNLYILWEDWVSRCFIPYSIVRSDEALRYGPLVPLMSRLSLPPTFLIISKVCVQRQYILRGYIFSNSRSNTS